jgi:hypothetical protein
MARSLLARLCPAWRRRPGYAARGRVADNQIAERAYRLTVALAEREAARVAFRRRWGAYVCHMPNDPYKDYGQRS